MEEKKENSITELQLKALSIQQQLQQQTNLENDRVDILHRQDNLENDNISIQQQTNLDNDRINIQQMQQQLNLDKPKDQNHYKSDIFGDVNKPPYEETVLHQQQLKQKEMLNRQKELLKRQEINDKKEIVSSIILTDDQLMKFDASFARNLVDEFNRKHPPYKDRILKERKENLLYLLRSIKWESERGNINLIKNITHYEKGIPQCEHKFNHRVDCDCELLIEDVLEDLVSDLERLGYTVTKYRSQEPHPFERYFKITW